MKPFPVYIGYDPRQPVSFTALSASIIKHSSIPVAIIPLVLETLPIKRQGLTPFTYSRFLVPYLQGYEGWAAFLDADIMARGDIAELVALRDEKYAAMIVRHEMKFERASVMLLNCAKCSVLTLENVETSDKLHGLSWLPEDEIGPLPHEWNHLVGYDEPNPDAKLVHYTQGVPIFPETRDSEHAEEWLKTAQSSVAAVTWRELMGNSVHAKPVLERLQRSASQ